MGAGTLKSINTWLPCLLMVSTLTWASSVLAQRGPTPRPSETATHTPTPAPEEKCCACIIPNEGEQDHDRFTEECEVCLLNENENPKAQGCSQKIIAEQSKFDQALTDLKRQGHCMKNVYIANNQHGPSFDDLADSIRVCIKTFPTCSLYIDDRSCKSFRNEDEVNTFLTNIRREMYPHVTLSMCGNTSSDFGSTCSRLAASKLFIISTATIDTPELSCNPEGSICDPAGDTWSCLDPNGKTIQQTCCQPGQGFGLGQTFGLWVNGASCKGGSSCANCQEHSLTCISSQTVSLTSCVKLDEGGEVCSDMKRRCTSGAHCVDGECRGILTPTPTAAAISSPSPATSSQQKALNNASISPVPGISHHFKASGSTLALAFTEKLFFGASNVTPISGPRGSSGVAIVSLDPVSTLGMVGLKNGDIIHFVNNQKVTSEVDVFHALSQSRKRTFITYSRQAPKASKERKSTLSVGTRWNWIVTIHQDDSTRE